MSQEYKRIHISELNQKERKIIQNNNERLENTIKNIQSMIFESKSLTKKNLEETLEHILDGSIEKAIEQLKQIQWNKISLVPMYKSKNNWEKNVHSRNEYVNHFKKSLWLYLKELLKYNNYNRLFDEWFSILNTINDEIFDEDKWSSDEYNMFIKYYNYLLKNITLEDSKELSYLIIDWSKKVDQETYVKRLEIFHSYLFASQKNTLSSTTLEKSYPTNEKIQSTLEIIYNEYPLAKKIHLSKNLKEKQKNAFIKEEFENIFQKKLEFIISQYEVWIFDTSEQSVSLLIQMYNKNLSEVKNNFQTYVIEDLIKRCKESHQKRIPKIKQNTVIQSEVTLIKEDSEKKQRISLQCEEFIQYISKFSWKNKQKELVKYLKKMYLQWKKLRVNYIINHYDIAISVNYIAELYKNANQLWRKTDEIKDPYSVEKLPTQTIIEKKESNIIKKESISIPDTPEELLNEMEKSQFKPINRKKILKQMQKILFTSDTNWILKKKLLFIVNSEKRVSKWMKNKNASIAIYNWRVRIKHINWTDYIMWIMHHNDYDKIMSEVISW